MTTKTRSLLISLAFLFLHGCVSTTTSTTIADTANDEEAAIANLNLGVAYLREGRPTQALEALDRALDANPRLRRRASLFVSGFLVIHGLLHALYVNHPDYEFSSPLSNLLIFGGAICGGAYLALELLGNRTNAT